MKLTDKRLGPVYLDNKCGRLRCNSCWRWPGGSTCAAYWAMSGKKSSLSRKNSSVTNTGDALGGKSLQHAHIGAHDAVIEGQHYKYTGITMTSSNGNSMTIDLHGNEFAHNTAGYVVQRNLLDNAVFLAATKHVEDNGGTVYKNHSERSGLAEQIRRR